MDCLIDRLMGGAGREDDGKYLEEEDVTEAKL